MPWTMIDVSYTIIDVDVGVTIMIWKNVTYSDLTFPNENIIISYWRWKVVYFCSEETECLVISFDIKAPP